MKRYLVGGYVRDRMLNIPAKDKDFVWVGATPQDMADKGMQQVGADFPVFIDSNGDENALARTESKSGTGYNGFDVSFNPTVTLEEDLIRRDLTINSMAMDEEGNIHDPYNGQADLKAGILRHVSPAFADDPLRVLRVARFAARFNFTIAPETMELMKTLTASGELSNLTSERVWQETERAMSEKHVNRYFKTLKSCGARDLLFPSMKSTAHNLNLVERVEGLSRFACWSLCTTEAGVQQLNDMYTLPRDVLSVMIKSTRVAQAFKDMDETVTPEELYNVFKLSDVFRDSKVGHHVLFSVMAGAKIKRPALIVSLVHSVSQINFADLSQNQQKTLKGPAISKAIEKLRVRKLAKEMKEHNVEL